MNEQEKREKVIKGIKCCTTAGFGCIENKECPYSAQRYGSHCVDSMLRDALALLKAQEPVKPLKMEVEHVRKEPVVFSYECPVCMCGLQRHWVACPICGTGVKW